MSRKSFKTVGYTLYLTTSRGGLIKSQLVDKLTREELELKYFTSLDDELENYLTSIGVSIIKVKDYLNTL